jgi:restriction system protein
VARKSENTLTNELSALLKHTPIWVGPLLAAIVFCFFWFIIPLLIPKNDTGSGVISMLPPLLHLFAWLLAGLVLLLWVGAEISKLSNRRLLDKQDGIQSIRQLPWREFERLVAEAYRRKGYIAEVVGANSADGGMDIRLTRSDQKVLVQCKQWLAYTVGVTIVRELLGVVTAEKATCGIVVTSGKFTKDARSFAQTCDKIQLVDGPQLVALIRDVQRTTQGTSPQPPALPNSAPALSPQCPSCGSEMILRTARKGSNAGYQFWGCKKYPACRGTKPHSV